MCKNLRDDVPSQTNDAIMLPTATQDCCSDQDTCVQGLLPCVLFGKNARKLGVLNEDDPCAAFCMMCTCACEQPEGRPLCS